MDEPTLTDETEALEASPPSGDRGRDQRIILGNTGQNVLGLAIGALATFAAQVIMTNRLGDVGFGVVVRGTCEREHAIAPADECRDRRLGVRSCPLW